MVEEQHPAKMLNGKPFEGSNPSASARCPSSNPSKIRVLD